ncbi:MAG: hypothetical protein E7254_01080 [Lachnospiraceae bacterium]|nr:hypothetical protein [Lachnospiraceae bacterium]
MKKIIGIICMALALTIGVISVRKTTTEYKYNINAKSRVEDTEYAEANIKRATELVDLFESNGNILVSPISLNCVLGMVANSSDENVKKEVSDYLGINVDEYNEYVNALIKSAKAKGVLNIANSVWYDNKYKLNGSFSKNAKKYYVAKVYKEPMNSSTVKKINRWAYKHTHRLIKQVVDSPPEYIAIFNATAFDGKWTKKFKKSDTETEDFTLADGSIKQVSMLNSEESIYYENRYAQGFEKTYGKKGEYSFIAILPKEEGEFKLADLDISSFMASRREFDDVSIKLPKFEYEWKSDDLRVNSKTLDNVLDELNLSGVKTCKMLENCPAEEMGTLFQKTKITLDESGTRAVAVTSFKKVSAVLGDYEKTVYLDRPFAYMIKDNISGEILFVGKYVNPEE